MTINAVNHELEDWSEEQVDLRISVDPVLFTLVNERLFVFLRLRTWEPFAGMWALPGAINPSGEQIEQTMRRELAHLGLPAHLRVEQLKTFDRPPQSVDGVTMPGRDPRGRVISVAYFATVCQSSLRDTPLATSRTGDGVLWAPLNDLPPLAFDHYEIVEYALQRLRNKIQYAPVAFELLPAEFTLTDLQGVYEAVLGAKLDKRNFRRKVLAEKVLTATDSVSRREKRPARLYRFNERNFAYSPRSLRTVPSFGARRDLGSLASV